MALLPAAAACVVLLLLMVNVSVGEPLPEPSLRARLWVPMEARVVDAHGVAAVRVVAPAEDATLPIMLRFYEDGGRDGGDGAILCGPPAHAARVRVLTVDGGDDAKVRAGARVAGRVVDTGAEVARDAAPAPVEGVGSRLWGAAAGAGGDPCLPGALLRKAKLPLHAGDAPLRVAVALVDEDEAQRGHAGVEAAEVSGVALHDDAILVVRSDKPVKEQVSVDASGELRGALGFSASMAVSLVSAVANVQIDSDRARPVRIEGGRSLPLASVAAAQQALNDCVAPAQRQVAALCDAALRGLDVSRWVATEAPAAARWYEHPRGADAALFDAAFEHLRERRPERAVRLLEHLCARQGDGGCLSPAAASVQEVNVRWALGLAWFRLGELENCVVQHNPQSCIFPLSGEGRHRNARGALRAVDVWSVSVSLDPTDLGLRFLLTVAAQAVGFDVSDDVKRLLLNVGGDGQSPALPEFVDAGGAAVGAEGGLPRLRNSASDLGLDAHQLFGGAVVDDFNGDGQLDVVLSSAGTTSAGDPRNAVQLLLNEGGSSFQNATDAWFGDGGRVLDGSNVVQVDFDADGWLDLYVMKGGWSGGLFPTSNALLRNLNGSGFADVTAGVGMPTAPTASHCSCWADVNGDGHVDVFVCEEVGASRLLLWSAAGRYVDVSEAALPNGGDLGTVKGCGFIDADNSGRPSLYVSTWGSDSENTLLVNGGVSGVAEGLGVPKFEPSSCPALRGLPHSFAVAVFDADNDGRQDILVGGFNNANLSTVVRTHVGDALGAGELAAAGASTLLRNLGGGAFADVSTATGVSDVLNVMGLNVADVDGDGFEDVLVGTGTPMLDAIEPNRMLLNPGLRGGDGGGGGVGDIWSSRWREAARDVGFSHLQKGHGVAAGDLTGSGTVDVVMNCGGWLEADRFFAAAFLNPGVSGNSWVLLRLHGKDGAFAPLNARVAAVVADARGDEDTPQYRAVHAHVSPGSSFGGSSLQLELGLGAARALCAVVVWWPGRALPRVELGDDKALELQLFPGLPSDSTEVEAEPPRLSCELEMEEPYDVEEEEGDRNA